MRAVVVTVLDNLCSCCLDEGRLTHLWLIGMGRVRMTFCHECDGRVEG